MSSQVASLKDRFAEFDELFRAREFRERVMLGCMVVAGIFFSIDTMMIQPVGAERAQVELGTERTQSEISRLEQEAKNLTSVVLTAEERRAQAELEQLKRQLAEIDSQMGSQIAELIPPRAIVSVLEELLAGDRNLKLLKLESQTPVRLGQHEDSPVSSTGLGLYRHGLRIEIEGDFNSTLSYLQQLEGSRWNLLWDRFEYRVQKFPTAVITIDLHTLSEREEWVGV